MLRRRALVWVEPYEPSSLLRLLAFDVFARLAPPLLPNLSLVCYEQHLLLAFQLLGNWRSRRLTPSSFSFLAHALS